MTVNNEASSVSFTGNGVTTVFPYTFRIPEDDMGHVGIFDIATSVLTELAPGTYSIIGVGSAFGGSVTYNPLGVPIPNTKRIVIYRDLDLVQELDLTNQSPYFAETLEETLDRIVMMLQQVSDAAARSIKVTLGSTTSPDALVAQLLATQAAAAVSAAAALASQNASAISETNAMKWATNPEDVVVTAGLYSAFHWAAKAMAYALALAMPAVPVALNYIRRNAANTAYEVRTPAQTAADIGAVRYDAAVALTALQQAFARDSVAAIGVTRVQIFTANGTYTPHAKMVSCVVEAVGAGGGGGGTTLSSANMQAAGGGGAGGEYAMKICTPATIGASKAVTIGTAGTGGAAGLNNGVAGTASSLGALCIANGGGPGIGNNGNTGTAGGTGGTGGTGDLVIPGEDGGDGAGGQLLTMDTFAGKGGNAGFNRGAGAAALRSTSNGGRSGKNYGGGGGGAMDRNATAARAGGNGAPGIVIVTEYCTA